MSTEKNINEEKKIKDHPKKGRRMLMYNRWIVKNIPFYFFIAAITLIYIANGHYADKAMRQINTTEKHLKEMEYEFKTAKQDVIFRSKESELAKAVEPLGLKQLLIPPMRIIDTLVEK
ncbi:MAG: FtsL-like putative cell division protein [Ginsengibacter sp.]